MSRTRARWSLPAVSFAIAALALAAGCGDDDDSAESASTTSTSSTTAIAQTEAGALDEVVEIEDGRGLYVRCTGTGSPTVVMEAGDADTGSYYAGIEPDIAATTRTCLYDRANLGQSDPAPGPRGLDDYVGDLELLFDRASIPGPYVLVGSSGGGYIMAGYALANPKQTAGLVLFDVFPPDPNPPKAVVKETDPGNPANIEERDYLQMENDAWDARKSLGDVPVRVVSVDYGNAPAGTPEATSVKGQQGWLVLSSEAEQVVAKTGHEIVLEDPELATEVILEVVKAAR